MSPACAQRSPHPPSPVMHLSLAPFAACSLPPFFPAVQARLGLSAGLSADERTSHEEGRAKATRKNNARKVDQMKVYESI